MLASGRNFRATVAEGADIESIRSLEYDLGMSLPTDLRELLEAANGLNLESSADDGLTFLLTIYSTTIVAAATVEVHEDLTEHARSRGEGMPASFRYISFARADDEDIVCRMSDHVHGGAVFIRDPWVIDIKWAKIAESIEEWLYRSMNAMATTTSGFSYFNF